MGSLITTLDSSRKRLGGLRDIFSPYILVRPLLKGQETPCAQGPQSSLQQAGPWL